MQYKVLKNVSEHNRIQNEVTLELWPEFMLHDPVSLKYWSRLFADFPDYQLSLESEREIIGTANAIPFFWDGPFAELPDEGWDWALERGFSDKDRKSPPNTLCGLQIAVSRQHQGKRINSLLLKEMKALANAKGFTYLTIPIRPSLKSLYPLIPMENYLEWTREKDGLPFDPWIRVHYRAGAEIVRVCSRSMHIPGTIAQWEEWTGLNFKESGQYIVPGALNPITVNLAADLGEYYEPNIWVLHEVK
ncbi:MAG: GNAT family N-acetyltransferase [Bacillota bacterium]